MRIDIVSLFPEMFAGPFGDSIIKRATDRGILDIHIINPRDFAFDKHRQVDDSPFGGGSGMVLKPEPMFRAVRFLLETTKYTKRRILLMCPSGQTFSQAKAKSLSDYEQLIFICGHYEGFDARIKTYLADEAISIGDYVLTGGELPAMVSLTRFHVCCRACWARRSLHQRIRFMRDCWNFRNTRALVNIMI